MFSCSIVRKPDERVGSSFILSYLANLVILLVDVVSLVWCIVLLMWRFRAELRCRKEHEIVFAFMAIVAVLQASCRRPFFLSL